MKLVVFCLFAAWCIYLASTSPSQKDNMQKRKLLEVQKELKRVNSTLQQSDKMLNTPPLDNEDSCCLSYLQCFRANMNVQFNVMNARQRKLYMSLMSNITERALCSSSNSENVQSTCQECASHPKTNAIAFFNRLNSLIQKSITRLKMQA